MSSNYTLIQDVLMCRRTVYELEGNDGKGYFAKSVIVHGSDIFKRVNHPRIEKYVETRKFSDITGTYDIFSAFDGETAEFCISFNKFKFGDILKISCSGSEGLMYLFKENIYHGDIKPSNVIISPEFDVGIIDFEFAKKFSDDTKIIGQTDEYSSSEVLLLKVPSLSSDIYSFGNVIYEMACGNITKKPPNFRKKISNMSQSRNAFSNFIKKSASDTTYPSTIGIMCSSDVNEIPILKNEPKFRKILASMLEVNFNDRLNAEEVYKELLKI